MKKEFRVRHYTFLGENDEERRGEERRREERREEKTKNVYL
jgi:hypothetical protein